MKYALSVTSLCILALCVSVPPSACGAKIKTNVSPVADVANAGGTIEESGQAIFQATIKSTVPQKAKDDVAIAVNKLGHAGLTLNAALAAYNTAKAAGADLNAQRATVQQALDVVNTFLADVGKALPPGTLQAVDALVNIIINTVVQVKVGVGL